MTKLEYDGKWQRTSLERKLVYREFLCVNAKEFEFYLELEVIEEF